MKLLLQSDVAETIERLNQEFKVDVVLANKELLLSDSSICGDRQVNEEVMRKISIGDASALSGLPEIPAPSSFFAPSGQKGKQKNLNEIQVMAVEAQVPVSSCYKIFRTRFSPQADVGQIQTLLF